MSETERVLKTRTEHHAAIMQKRRSGEGVKKTADKEAKVPKQQVLNILDHSIKKIPYSLFYMFRVEDMVTNMYM